MIKLTSILVVVLLAIGFAQEKVSTELTLKFENQLLREQLAETQKALAQCSADRATVQAKFDGFALSVQKEDLDVKHAALEEELKKALGAKEGDTIDWTSSPPKLVKKSPPPKS
jgi:hypothetical protein